jgi:hypothetical protein
VTARKRQQQTDSALTIRDVWMEGIAPIPRDPISIYETNINILLGLFLGKGTSMLLGLDSKTTRPVSIINKLSGKALEVEDSSNDEGARIQQATRNGAANQLWFIRFIKRAAIPEVIFQQVYRYWPKILAFPQATYSVIAGHSGLCLDTVSGSTYSDEAAQRFPLKDGSSHHWAFVPDKKGSNFIVNLCSGRVLDVADSSLNNYATIRQHPFNGGDSQRWQLFH